MRSSYMDSGGTGMSRFEYNLRSFVDWIGAHFNNTMFTRLHTTSFYSLCRRICRHDNPLPSQAKNWLLCDPDLLAMYYDCHSVASVFLAQQRVCPCPHGLWWVLFYGERGGGRRLQSLVMGSQSRRKGGKRTITEITGAVPEPSINNWLIGSWYFRQLHP